MHSPTKPYLLLALLPFALANIVTQISDGQIQEPAEAPASVAPKFAVAPTSAPAAAAPPPATSTSTFTPSPKPSPTLPPALKEAGAIAAPRTANASIPAPAKIEEAATTAPILIAPAPAPASNVTIPPHHANYEAPHPSASIGKVLPVENGTAPTVPVVPTLPAVESEAPTGVEGSPREAGTTHAIATGVAARLGVSVGVGTFGMVGLAVLLS